MAETVFRNEQFMNDVFQSIFSQLEETRRRRIWDPFNTRGDAARFGRSGEVNANVPKTDVFTAKKGQIGEENVKTCIQEDCTMQSHIDMEKKNTRIDKIVQLSENSIPTISKKRMMSESENEKMEISCKNQACKDDKNDFQDWCRRRNKEFEENKPCGMQAQSASNSFQCSVELNKEMDSVKTMPSSTQEYSKIKSISSQAVKDTSSMKERKLINAKFNNIHSYNGEHSPSIAASKKNTSFPYAKEKIGLCIIKVADMKGDKSFELISKLSDFSRVRKNFPKLSEIVPDVDSEYKKVDYSAEAVNIIFRYVFNHSLNFSAISSPIIGIEVLAATQFWKIDKFHQIFQTLFLQEALTPNNVSSIYSRACHFGLKEVCDKCQNISSDIIDVIPLKNVKKSCTVTISRYIEPSEFSIPFCPLIKLYETSFERRVQNKIVFKAISGTYIIRGIQVQLNKDHLKESDSKLNIEKDLEIEYSIKSTSNNQKVDNQMEKKPVRPINIIYFKKNVIVKHGDIAEITVETDTLPYLCSHSLETERVEKDSTGKFELKMHSYSPINCSGEKVYLFIIGKLLYVKRKHPGF